MTKPAFETLSPDEIAAVSGGRLIVHKGPSAAVVKGLEMLVKTINEVGQVLAAGGQQQQQQMMQMMQQLMERRRAGG